ncbi:MAG TPA: hypothetical protein VFI84_04390 [Candidatus Saccharimonadales bacterium]|nr:hypothetical protein [Candidatus Saccharimonadales bacterium]
MSKLSKIAATVAIAPALLLSGTALAYGQVEQGDIYRVKDLTTNGTFADTINSVCGDTVQFRVRVHNGGPDTLTNVKVAATLNSASSTSHGSQASITADNAIDNMTVTANAGVNTDKATTADYVSGSTQLLNYSATPGGESVLRNLPDGILNGGVNIGSVGPLTADTEEVQFQAKLNCTTPTPNKIQVCALDTKQIVTINESDFDSSKYTKDLTKCQAAPTTLVNTGAGDVAGLFAAVAVAGAFGYRLFLGRRLSRQ